MGMKATAGEPNRRLTGNCKCSLSHRDLLQLGHVHREGTHIYDTTQCVPAHEDTWHGATMSNKNVPQPGVWLAGKV